MKKYKNTFIALCLVLFLLYSKYRFYPMDKQSVDETIGVITIMIVVYLYFFGDTPSRTEPAYRSRYIPEYEEPNGTKPS